MALITKVSPDVDASSAMVALQAPLIAGEALEVADACYIAGADGLVYKADGTAGDELAQFAGFAARTAAIGDPITLYGIGTRFKYATGMTPGDRFFVAATAGRLDDAATTGGTVAVAMAVSATDIICISMG